MVREDAQHQFVGQSVQSVIALVNLMKVNKFESDVDRVDFVTNGFKILRIISAEKNVAVKLVDDYNLCLKHVLDVLEENIHDRTIKDEGREIVTNLTKY